MEQVRQLTLVTALNAIVKVSNGINHFDQSPEGKEAMRAHVLEVGMWWPNYGGIFADLRINFLIGAKVVRDLFPNLPGGFPQLSGATRAMLLTTIPMLMKFDKSEEGKEVMPEEYRSEQYWKDQIAKVDRITQAKYDAINLEAERQKNPGKVLVGKQWLEYGTKFFDDNQTEMVVINHQVIPLQSLETRGQYLENLLAVTPAEQVKPAIDLINELGGTMFAAICRAGLAKLGQVVADCHDAGREAQGLVGKPVDGSGIEVRTEEVKDV